MKIEKNIMLCSILSLAIGISAIMPLAIFMDTARAQSNDEQWLDIDVPWAYFNADATDNMYWITGGIAFSVLHNYDLLGQHIDARVDYVELTIYTDDMLLSKSHFYFGTYRPDRETLTHMDNGGPAAWFKVPWLTEKYGIAEYGMRTGDYVNAIPNTGMALYNVTELPPEEWQNISPDARQTQITTGDTIGGIDENTNAILAALENTQTIYLDIRRIACITFADNGTVTTSEYNQFIQHIELTKNSNGEFTFGDVTGAENLIYQARSEMLKRNYIAGIPAVGSGLSISWG